jgi:hypothetical protein
MDWMTTVIECTEGHYEVRETSYGEAYIWCPECVVVECDCGQRLVLSTSETACSCGRDHATLIWKMLATQSASHPWEAEYDRWRNKQAENLLSQDTYSLELSRLD